MNMRFKTHDIFGTRLGRKLLLQLLVISIIPMTLLFLTVIDRNHEYLDTSTRQHMVTSTRLAGHTVFQALDLARGDLLSHAFRLSSSPVDSKAFHSISIRGFGHFALFDMQGKLIMKSPDGNTRNAIPAPNDLRIARLLDGDAVASEPYLTSAARTTRGTTLSLYAPIRAGREQRVQFILAGEMKPQILWEAIRGKNSGSGGFILVLNKQGQVIASSISGFEAMSEAIPLVLGRDSQTQPPGAMSRTFDAELPGYGRMICAENRLLLAPSFHAEDFIVLLCQPYDVLFAPLRGLLFDLTLLGGIMAGIVVLLAFRITRSLIHPVSALTTAMVTVASGDLTARVVPSSRDEIGRMGTAFNKMVMDLSTARLNMEKTTASLLEAEKDAYIGHMAAAVANQKFRVLFESSRDAIMTAEPPFWKFTACNQAALNLFRVKTKEEFSALGFRDVSPERQPNGGSSAEKAREMIGTALSEGTHFFEWTHMRSDGSEFSATVLLSRMEQDEQIFVQATVQDVTEKKRIEQDLIARQQQLIQSEKMAALGRMAAGIAHELNQPLNAMRNYATEILLNHQDGIAMSPDEERENLDRAIVQVDRMAEIIKNMRLFVRETGDVEREPILVEDFVEYPLSLLGKQLSAHDIRVEIERGVPGLSVVGNRNRLQQVMVNLVVNAHDAIKQARDDSSRKSLRRTGAPENESDRIILRWRSDVARDAKIAVIEVEDTGIGISSEDASRIFEPFFTTKKLEHGVGLGLAICHEIVAGFGGTLRFESKVGLGQAGQGSIFILELPLAPEA